MEAPGNGLLTIPKFFFVFRHFGPMYKKLPKVGLKNNKFEFWRGGIPIGVSWSRGSQNLGAFPNVC